MKLYEAYKAVGSQDEIWLGKQYPLGIDSVCMLCWILLRQFWEETPNKYLLHLFISPTENYLR